MAANRERVPDVRHVEMLGLQGAGKTTLALAATAASGWCSIAHIEERARLRPRRRPRHRLAQHLLPDRVLLRLFTDARPDAKDAGAYAVRHVAHLDAVMRAAAGIADPADRELAVQLLFESWSELGFATRFGRDGDAVLHHEAVLQRTAFLLALLPDASPVADEILTTLPLPHGVLLLELPLETATERVRARAGEFTMTEVMPSMERQVAAIAAHLRSVGVPMAVIDAERPAADSLPDVLSFLADRRAKTG